MMSPMLVKIPNVHDFRFNGGIADYGLSRAFTAASIRLMVAPTEGKPKAIEAPFNFGALSAIRSPSNATFAPSFRKPSRWN